MPHLVSEAMEAVKEIGTPACGYLSYLCWPKGAVLTEHSQQARAARPAVGPEDHRVRRWVALALYHPIEDIPTICSGGRHGVVVLLATAAIVFVIVVPEVFGRPLVVVPRGPVRADIDEACEHIELLELGLIQSWEGKHPICLRLR